MENGLLILALIFLNKNMKKIIILSLKQLKEISSNALYKYCPLCGQMCENYYCKECNFKYEKDKIYFSYPQ